MTFSIRIANKIFFRNFWPYVTAKHLAAKRVLIFGRTSFLAKLSLKSKNVTHEKVFRMTYSIRIANKFFFRNFWPVYRPKHLGANACAFFGTRSLLAKLS